MASWSLRTLAELADSPRYDKLASGLLPRPHREIWCWGNGGVEDTLAVIERALPVERKRLFYQTLLASFLLSPDEAPSSLPQWLSERVDIRDLSGIDSGAAVLAAWTWRRVPIVLAGSVQDAADRVKYLLIGCHDGPEHPVCPSWGSEVLDGESIRALNVASSLARRRHPGKNFFFWPIVDPAGGTKIQGPSLGLPAYLGALSAAYESDVPNLAATGALTSDGGIEEVAALPEKLLAIGRHRFAGFIYPGLCAVDPLAEYEAGEVQKLRISRLVEAESLWLEHSPEIGFAIAEFTKISGDAPRLLHFLPRVAQTVLYTIRKNSQSLHDTLKMAAGSGGMETVDALLGFAADMENLMERPGYSRMHAAVVIGLFDEELVKMMVDRAPGAAFTLARLKMRLASHLGQMEDQECWQEIANRCYHRIPPRELEGPRLLFLVDRFIATQHNSFSFTPEIPREFAAGFDAVVPYLEETHRAEVMRYGNAADFSLGCYYGTMAQHYAFCGTSCLQQTEEFTRKARVAFGQGMYPHYRDHYLRQYSYLAYAYLDAGECALAEEALLRYLEIDELRAFPFHEESNPYKHALIARFIAETGEQFAEYLAWAWENPYLRSQHPWQLWLYNMGRACGRADERERFLKQSLRLCQDPAAGAAVKVMGLLPLTALCADGCDDRVMLESAGKTILQAVEAFPAHREAFRVASLEAGGDLLAALALLNRDIAKLFPFTYR